MSDEFDDEDSGDNIMLHINEKGEAEMAEALYMSKKDKEKLLRGMELLRTKYPEISKECFSDA